MPDKLNQIGKILGQVKRDVQTVLNRDYPAETIIERGRDIFDKVVPFEFEFMVPSVATITTLDVVFSLPPDLCCAGIICGICENYVGFSPFTTTYPVMPESVRIIVTFDNGNEFPDEQVLSEIDGDEWEVLDPFTIEVDSFFGTAAYPIRICYTYNTLDPLIGT